MTAAQPDFSYETTHNKIIIGFDEAGRGPIAGPVTAACVYVPSEKYDLPFWAQVNDSKKLSKTLRDSLFKDIKEHCIWGIGHASPQEIDQINILQASFLAMERAYHMCLKKMPELINSLALIDGNRTPKTFPIESKCLIKGDSKSLSIAAASILAKVTRDEIMHDLAQEYPHYSWESNAAYPTKAHLEALKTYGITPHHRQSFAPVRRLIKEQAA